MSDRMKDFKNKGRGDAMRGRRRNNNVELRKNKRVEQIIKRRQVVDDSDSKTPLGDSQSANTSVTKGIAEIPNIIRDMQSPDLQTVIQATTKCRMILSKEKNPPIDPVIEAGLVPVLTQFLHATESAKLQFEAAWALTNVASGNSEQTRCVVQCGALPQFIKLLSSEDDDVRDQAVWAIGNIAGDGSELRDLVLSSGALPPLMNIMQPQNKITLIRNATWTLSNLCRGKSPAPDFKIVRQAIPAFAAVVQSSDVEVMTDAAWGLSYLTDGENYKIAAVLEAPNVISRLIELLHHNRTTVQTPALRAIGNIVTGTDEQTQAVLDAGALGAFAHMLDSGKESIRKETCWTISNITAGSIEQIQAAIDAGLVPGAIKQLREGEFRTRKEAAWVLTNLTTGGTPMQIQYLVQQGGIQAMVDMLSAQEAKIVLVLLDGLTNILKAGQQTDGSNPCADWIEECGGMEKIEILQNHENEEVYQKSLDIIDKYFSEEEEELPVPTLEPQLNAAGGFAFPTQQAVQVVGGFNF